MNVWIKLQTVRQLMSKATLKKTGENKYSKYNYYTLDDILPALTQFLADQKLVTTLDMGEEKSIYRVINAEKPEEVVEFSCPTVMAEMKGSTKIQELGSTMTYIHRYLVLWAFSICEPEWVEIAKEEADRKKAEADVARRDAQAKHNCNADGAKQPKRLEPKVVNAHLGAGMKGQIGEPSIESGNGLRDRRSLKMQLSQRIGWQNSTPSLKRK